MRTVWKRIDNWLTVHAPELGELLLSGATDEEIHATEAVMGVEFPEDIKASYRIHNGVRFSPPSSNFIGGRFALFSLKEMIEMWEQWHQPQKNIIDYSEGDSEDDWRKDIREATEQQGISLSIEGIDAKLVPLMNWPVGVYLCFDAAHTLYESFGQLLEYDPESGLALVAPSLRAFLSAFADDLEAGKYAVEPWGNSPRLRPADPPPDETEHA
jgi:cell wall assembly regulator SMI1